MKPFNLDAALAGDLVVLRNGETAKVVAVNLEADEFHEVIGWRAGGTTAAWSADGRFGIPRSKYDIIGMAPKKRLVEGWVNVYKSEDSGFRTGNIHATEQFAKDCAHPNAVAQVKISFEIEE